MPAMLGRSTRSASRASTIACVGAGGYLIGLALPLPPPFDVPLLLLVGLVIVAAIMGPTKPKRATWLAVLPAFAFVVARLWSSLSGPDVGRGLQFLAPFLPALLLFYVVSEWTETRHQLIAMYACLTVTGLVLATTLLFTIAAETADANVWTRAASAPMLAVKNDITVVAVLAPVALAVVALRPRPWILLLAVYFFASLITVIVLVRSRTALLTVIVGIACFTVLAGRKALTQHKRLALLTLAGVLVIAFATDAFLGFRFANKLMHDSHGSGRLALWGAALAMLRDAPLLGHGPGSFVVEYRTYMDAVQAPTAWAHNLYLELLAEQGAVGFVSFLALTAVALSMFMHSIKSRESEVRGLAAGAGSAFIAFLVAAFLELSFIRVWVPIVLLTLVGLLTSIPRIEKRAAARPSD